MQADELLLSIPTEYRTYKWQRVARIGYAFLIFGAIVFAYECCRPAVPVWRSPAIPLILFGLMPLVNNQWWRKPLTYRLDAKGVAYADEFGRDSLKLIQPYIIVWKDISDKYVQVTHWRNYSAFVLHDCTISETGEVLVVVDPGEGVKVVEAFRKHSCRVEQRPLPTL